MNFINDLNRLKNTPIIPEEVYSNLPKFWQECLKHFHNRRQKDVFFTSSLSLFSGCIKGVKGTLGDEVFFPNLYTLVVAPPANRKGVIKHAKQCIEPLHDSLKIVTYGEMFDSGNSIQTNSKGKLLIIPADSSAAMFLKIISDNNGEGILCETELDTLINSQKQDWGNYSEKLRAGFQHETISFSRKGEGGKIIEIRRPKFQFVFRVHLTRQENFCPRLRTAYLAALYFTYIVNHLNGRTSVRTTAGRPMRKFLKI